MVSDSPAKFGGHRHRGSEYIFLVCRIISEDHGTKG